MYKRLSETAISIFYKKNDLVLLANLQKKCPEQQIPKFATKNDQKNQITNLPE